MRYQVQNKAYEFQVQFYPCGLSAVPHIHSHLEMIYLVSGRARGVLDGESYLFKAGDLFLAGPNQLHFYDNLEEPVSFYLILFSLGMDGDVNKLLRDRIPADPVVRKERLPQDLPEQLAGIRDLCQRTGPWEELEAKGRFLSFLGQVLDRFDYRQTQGDHDSIKQVLTYCLDHYTQPITLDSTSKQLHLSKYYISHIFTQRMGRSFTSFLADLRLEHACQLLGEQGNITQVAFASGFSSVRTFNRAFLKRMGITPREYIVQKAAAAN